MTACWVCHKKGSLYEGLLQALTRAAETFHEQEKPSGSFREEGKLS
jgi:hypothetical protein